jgi:F-type H+-transporting ATPase subunit alpha
LRQGEFQPVPVIEQLAVLLALASGLFDAVPLERVTEAETAVRRIATALPDDVRERIVTGAKLSAADRDTVVEKSREALRPFLTVHERNTAHPAPKD